MFTVDIIWYLEYRIMSSIIPSMLSRDIAIVTGVLLVSLFLKHIEALRTIKYVLYYM